MKVLLTGSQGFLGRAVADCLRKATDCDLFTLGRRSTGADREIVADLTDSFVEERLPNRIDTIIHTAAYVPAKESMADLATAMAVNAEGTLRLLEYAVKSGAKRFVYISSAAVYGLAITPDAIPETAEPRPDNPYALSKLAGELMLEPYRFVHGIETVALRFSYVYGAHMRATTVVKKFEAMAAAGAPIPLFNAGQDYFDLVHLSDAVRAVVAAMQQGAGMINVGSGKPTSVLNLATEMVAVSGSDSRIEKLPATGTYHSKYLDIQKAAESLNWQPRVSLQEGLRNL